MLVVDQPHLSPDSTALKPQLKTALMIGTVAALTVLALGLAAARVKEFRGGGEAGARVWFYDQDAGKLYPAPRNRIPPDGNGRVRAVAIGFQGLGNGVSQLKIAYLEEYSAEFKALLERAESAHAAKRPFGEPIPSPDSAYFRDNTLVKRPGEASWHPIGTEEARRVMAEWRQWRGPAGQSPIISVPSTQ
jgi:hypothetical protein